MIRNGIKWVQQIVAQCWDFYVVNSRMTCQPSIDLSLHHDSFLDLLMTLHPSPKDITKDMMRQEDNFNNTCINSLPSKNESLITSVIPSPQIGSTHEDTLVQEEIINTYFKDPPLKDEAFKSDVDPSPREYLFHEDTLVIEDDMMATFPSNTTPSFNNHPSRDEALRTSASTFPKIDSIHDSIFLQEEIINTSFNNPYHMNDFDPFPRVYLPCKDTLEKENALRLRGFTITNSTLR